VIIRLVAEVHELREKFQEHSHEMLGAEPDFSIDEEPLPAKKKLTPAEVFGDDYYDFQI
jgi:hypothetical protein